MLINALISEDIGQESSFFLLMVLSVHKVGGGMSSEHVPKDLYLEGKQRLSSEFLFSSPTTLKLIALSLAGGREWVPEAVHG